MVELALSQPEPLHGEDLSDEQIDQLLKQAEDRLRNDAMPATTTTRTSRYIPQAQKLELPSYMRPYIESNSDVASADSKRLLGQHTTRLAGMTRKIEDPLTVKRKKIEEKKATAGKDWFNLPRTNLTPELKRDLQLIQMRSVLDPKKFYKKESTKAKPPEFSQVGTVIEGPTDYFSGRIPKRERKRTLVEEVLAGESQNGRFRKKYLEVQAAKTSGKKADYKQRIAKKYGKRNIR